MVRSSRTTTGTDAVPEGLQAHVQLRVLPAEHGGRGIEARADREAARAVETRVLLGDLRRGRLDARADAARRAGPVRRRPRRGTAYFLHRLVSHERARDPGAVQEPRDPACRRAARGPAV